jgi:hypothetical protein
MRAEEIEAEALKLPEPERVELAERLLASVHRIPPAPEDDPVWGLGTNPVDTGHTDASVAHDRYLYGPAAP